MAKKHDILHQDHYNTSLFSIYPVKSKQEETTTHDLYTVQDFIGIRIQHFLYRFFCMD